MKEEIKERLIKHVNFLADEIKDYSLFKSMTWETYKDDRNKRRNVERWVENLVNSSIDISRLILSGEDRRISETYKEIVLSVSLVEGFDKEEAEKLAEWVKFRNIVVHEYLDIRWNSIKRFIRETGPVYKNFLAKVKDYIKEKL